jgi:hypothetical protein
MRFRGVLAFDLGASVRVVLGAKPIRLIHMRSDDGTESGVGCQLSMVREDDACWRVPEIDITEETLSMS